MDFHTGKITALDASKCTTLQSLAISLLLLCASPFMAHAATPNSPYAQTVEAADICTLAARRAEVKHNLPKFLLTAIGLTESGKWDKDRKEGVIWPWTVTSGGPGKYFPTQQAAIAYAQSLKASGVRNIDTGCFQINQHYHPNAFNSLAEAFDPFKNAEYAALFLKKLRKESGTWTSAVAAYHSKTKGKGLAYRQKVYNRLNDLHVSEQNKRQQQYEEIRQFRYLRHSYIQARRNHDLSQGNRPSNTYARAVYANNIEVTRALYQQ